MNMQKHRLLTGIYLIFILVGGVLLSMISRVDLHLIINRYHDDFFDYFFRYVTKLGEPAAIGAVIVCSVVLLSRRAAFYLLLSNIVNLVIVLTLKQLIFDDVDRPKRVFRGVADLYYVPGVDVHIYNSFPSGHTAAAFATYTALILLTRQPLLKWLWFLLAIAVGLSRIYLSQHFFIDVYFGSLIGVLVALSMYILYYNRPKESIL